MPATTASAARLAIVAVSLFLLWRVFHVNVGLYENTGQPRLAAFPVPAADSAGDPKAGEKAALGRLLDDNPAEVAALLALARERETAGDVAGASKAYRVALDVAPLHRETLARASAHFLRQEQPEGLDLLARLVESYPGTRDRAFPVLAELLAGHRYRAQLSKIASRNPAWLDPFVAYACTRGTDPSLLAPLALQVSSAAKVPSRAAACVVDRLRVAGRWEQAYHLWLNLLPKERRTRLGFVFNGGFDFPASNMGFDWTISQDAERRVGHTAEIVRLPGAEGARALRVAYNGGRQAGVPARQYLLLAPGRYELRGLARPQGIKAARGIYWTVRCVQGDKIGKIVARSDRFLGAADWQPFSMPVEIDGACGGYSLQLEPVAEEGQIAFVSGSAWFDDLVLWRR